MKSAALIFGVIAGLLGAGVLVLGNLDTSLDSSLSAIAALGPDHDAIARLIVYLVPAVGWLGAGLALGYPRLGGLVLLLSAAAWAAIAFVAGHGAVFFAAAPFTFAAAAGLVALFARRPARPVAAPIGNANVDGVIFEAVAAAEPTRRRNETLPARTVPPRGDPRLPAARRSNERGSDSSTARIPPPFQDLVPDEESMPGPAPVEATVVPLGTSRPVEAAESPAIPVQADEIPTVPPAVDEVIVVAGPHPRRPGEWTLPTPIAAAQAASPRYAADRQTAAPSRVEPLAPAALPATDQRPRGVSALDFGAANDFSARRSGDVDASADPMARDRFGRRQDPDDAPAFRPDTPDDRPRRGGGVRRFLRLLIALLFILALLGLAAAVYLDYRRGPQSILFGRHPHPAATTGTAIGTVPPPSQPAPASIIPTAPAAPAAPSPASLPAPHPTAVHSPTPSTPAPAIVASTPTPPATAPTAPASPTPAAPVPLAPAAPIATPTVAAPPAPTPATTSAPVETAPTPATTIAGNDAVGTYSDPVSYCAAIGTADAPDAHYTGPTVPKTVAAALLVAQSTPADQIHWRCANGAAFACNAHHTNACMPTPTVDGMLKYCALHPGATNLPAPNGSWSCTGTRPVIPEDQSWPVDPQGFFPGAWIRVSPVG